MTNTNTITIKTSNPRPSSYYDKDSGALDVDVVLSGHIDVDGEVTLYPDKINGGYSAGPVASRNYCPEIFSRVWRSFPSATSPLRCRRSRRWRRGASAPRRMPPERSRSRPRPKRRSRTAGIRVAPGLRTAAFRRAPPGGPIHLIAIGRVDRSVARVHSRRHARISICWSPRGTERRNQPGSVTVSRPAGL